MIIEEIIKQYRITVKILKEGIFMKILIIKNN